MDNSKDKYHAANNNSNTGLLLFNKPNPTLNHRSLYTTPLIYKKGINTHLNSE
jgi:hypothetical protein